MFRNIRRLVFILVSQSIRGITLPNRTREVLVHVTKARGLRDPDLAHPRHPQHSVLVHHVPVHRPDRAGARRLGTLSFEACGRAAELGHLPPLVVQLLPVEPAHQVALDKNPEVSHLRHLCLLLKKLVDPRSAQK